MDHIIKKLKQKFAKGLPGSVFCNRKTTTGLTQLVDFCLTKMRNIFARKQQELFPRQKFTTGFTLIEMMVSVSIFAIVVMISMTAILTVVDLNKKAQSMKSVMNNLNFAIETMTRSIKTGSDLDVDSSGEELTLTDQNDDFVKYYLSGDKLKRDLTRDEDGRIETQTITADEVKIESLTFGDLTDEGQPSVVLILKGEAKMNERITSEFNIQSTITQRLP